MPFRHPPEVRRRAVALVLDGARPREAAATLGIDHTTVYAWLHEDAPAAVAVPARRCWRCWADVPVDGEAYAQLLGLYLGDGWLTRTARGSSWFLSIACCDAYPALADECADVMGRVLATSVCRVRRKGCHDVKAYSRHWPCLLPQHAPGKKHDRPIVLEDWQRVLVERHPGRLLRGLFQSDGWRGENVAVRRVGDTVVRYRYPRYEFSNRSADVRGICGDALDALGIAWRPNGPYRLSVARREAVAALDEHVGPKA